MRMKLFRLLAPAAVIAVLAAFSSPVPAHANEISDAERKAMETVIRDYLMKNPEVVVEAIRKFQADQEAMREAEAKKQIGALRQQLEQSAGSPVGGNPKGDVTVVEFFDYRCSYCKRVHPTVTEAVADDGKVRVVYKEFPILGPDSVSASRAALGVFFTEPKKYQAFHDALMTARGTLDEARVMAIAADVGLKPDDVKSAMKDPRVEQEIQHNMALAQALNINGTPAFVIGGNLIPGAIDKETLQQMIKEARGG